MATLNIDTTTDFRNQVIEDIDAIQFATGPEQVIGLFAAAQFVDGVIAPDATVAGGSLNDRLEIYLGSLTSFDASGLQFTAGAYYGPKIIGSEAGDVELYIVS